MGIGQYTGSSGLRSPLQNRGAGILPGVQTELPQSSVQLREEKPTLVSTTEPLELQGWERGASSGPIPTRRRKNVHQFSASQSSPQEATSSEEDFDPETWLRAPIYENINPSQPGAPRVPIPRTKPAQPNTRGAAAGSDSEASSASGFECPTQTQSAPVSPSKVKTPKSILKQSAPKAPKKVKYSPSTKRDPPVSGVPEAPDFNVSVRPTSTLDILDEIVAGQPSKRKDGQLIPDTLLKVEPVQPEKKKKKTEVPPTDRITRSQSKKK